MDKFSSEKENGITYDDSEKCLTSIVMAKRDGGSPVQWMKKCHIRWANFESSWGRTSETPPEKQARFYSGGDQGIKMYKGSSYFVKEIENDYNTSK